MSTEAFVLRSVTLLEYCSTIWDPYQQTFINKLEMIQHRAARFVLNKPWRKNYRDSITDVIQSLNWLSLEKRRRDSRVYFSYLSF